MDIKNIYTTSDITIMKDAEDSLNRKNDRVQEIIEYAKISKIKSIGIAHCTSLSQQANVLSKILSKEGFTVEQVNCKIGKIPFSDLIPNYQGISCNPAGQAKYLEDKKTELNIVLGLCLGHDMIFNSKSKAPVTTLIVKDRKLKHSTINLLNNYE